MSIARNIGGFTSLRVTPKTVEGGHITADDIATQIHVLNTAYEPSGISFSLSGTDYTTNPRWFNTLGPRSNVNRDVKQKLRKGDVRTLNVYSTGFVSGTGEKLLGYSTFPSDYEDNVSDRALSDQERE